MAENKKKPFVSVIVCTKDRAQSLEKHALPSLHGLNYNNFEVIVVDDASLDNTPDIAKSFEGKIKNLKIIKNKKNKGLCFVRNLGVTHSKGEIVAFTDDDCSVDKEWLNELVKIFEKDKKVVCVGGDAYIGDSNNLYNPNKGISGCNMSFRREIFDTFEFDTSIYFNTYCYYDDVDLTTRLITRGLIVKYNSNAKVRHFLEPGEHRKYAEIGGPLNYVYICSKNMLLRDYYYVLLRHAIVSLLNNKILNPIHDIENGFTQLQKAYENKNMRMQDLVKVAWILYVLFLSIPIKSRGKK